jgi:quercetin dioxygenase-like cupin family protein
VKSASFATADLSDAWVDGDDSARWSSAAGETGESSGTSLLEVPPGCRLPRHTDSAEETIVVVDGTAWVAVGDEQCEVPAGGAALVPECVTHEVRNAGDGPLRFVAIYASTDVVTTYERAIQPGGERERAPLG